MNYAATLLTPKYRKFKFIANIEEFNKILLIAKSYISEDIEKSEDIKISPKLFKLSGFGEDSDDDTIAVEDEISQYLALSVDKEKDLVKFYEQNEVYLLNHSLW